MHGIVHPKLNTMKKLAVFFLLFSLKAFSQPYLPVGAGYSSIDVSNTSLDNLTSVGFYRGIGLTAAPDGGWWYITVEVHNNGGGVNPGWAKQVVTAYGAGNTYPVGTTFMRFQTGGTTWTPWAVLITANTEGHVGVGTITPHTTLAVNSDYTFPFHSSGSSQVAGVGIGGVNGVGVIQGYNSDFSATNNVCLQPTAGHVSIGTTSVSNAQGWARVMQLHGATDAKFLVTTDAVKGGIYSHNSWEGLACVKIGTESEHPVVLMAGYGRDAMFINTNGNIGIGTHAPGDYRLAVEGILGARKIKVTQAAWADYVFDSCYQLKPLNQVEQYIQENKHLPDVPSAATVDKEGIDVGDSQALLLKKIEELTLYIIQQNKEIKAQHEEIKELKQEMKALKKTE